MDVTFEKMTTPPLLVADHAALDFLNTLAGEGPRQYEWLGDGEALLRWTVAAGLLSAPDAQRVQASVPAAELDGLAADARALRSWWYDVVTNHAGHPLLPGTVAELAPLNRLLAEDRLHREVAPVEGGFAWRHVPDWTPRMAVLQPIAERIGDLVCRADFAAVRLCEGVGCTLWFHDTSVNHTRRWCSMAICGNRAKAAAHRARKRAGTHVLWAD
jgi:predicted RNA-binding Zn ribbon-like protein